MLIGVILAIAASYVANASENLFAECPDAYTHFCLHGTCRFLVSEWTPSCICFTGYMGSRCQKMDLLQMMAGDPHSILAAALLVVLTMTFITYFGIYLCRRKAQSELKTIDVNGCMPPIQISPPYFRIN
ncbi:protransforming growth factor alpha-like isoform X2 [Hyla sarda]|uniref:protransforming growth factor alpha-like isoform X2 n=1 Tax=Hyla sarda TaxID=327740 RepID=UPI0024C2DCDE|nr:protransforming growth factor alpha-like isoform X2 [Hyla sarda]